MTHLPTSTTLLSFSALLFACFTGACAGSPRPEAVSGLKRLSFVENLTLEQNPRLAPTPGMFSSLTHVAAKLSVSGCPGVSEGDVFPSQTPIETASR